MARPFRLVLLILGTFDAEIHGRTLSNARKTADSIRSITWAKENLLAKAQFQKFPRRAEKEY